MENMYTLEEVSKHLRVPVEAVQKEIEKGRLQAIDVAGHIRVSEVALAQYKNEAVVKPGRKPHLHAASQAKQDDWLKLQPAVNFTHRWPDNKVEQYKNVQEGVATHDGRQYHVKIGWTTRKSGGEERKRWLVIVDRYPTVEFVKCTEAEPDGREYAASIIRDRKNKQVPALATVPPEYKEFSTAVYSDKVKGSGSSSGQAVVCPVNDFPAMVRHALIRTKYREERR